MGMVGSMIGQGMSAMGQWLATQGDNSRTAKTATELNNTYNQIWDKFGNLLNTVNFFTGASGATNGYQYVGGRK